MIDANTSAENSRLSDHSQGQKKTLVWKLTKAGKESYRDRFKDSSELAEIYELVKIAKQSPLFNASLSSKELFHSNFIAWTIDPETGSYGQEFL
ncbi:MAG: hypothetical protein JXQ97_08635 [Natronospirillum sp.]